MTYKQIEAARETRLWLGQVIVPTVLTVATLLTVPEIRDCTRNKYKELKSKLKRS